MRDADLQEIGHSGGQVTFRLEVIDGRLAYQVGWSHCRPNAAAIFAVYALPQGVAIDDIALGGIGTPWNPPPIPGCFPVFIASDSTGMFGHECPACKGYWRSKHASNFCPYCATRGSKHLHFLTQAQKRYVAQYCDTLARALAAGEPGEYRVDMDAVADAVGRDVPKPPFYYAEERQQNQFTCSACHGETDVLGTFAYCTTCGTRNDLSELDNRIKNIRTQINSSGSYENCVRDAVAAFDSFAGVFSAQLEKRVPVVAARRNALLQARHHDLSRSAALFKDFFGIDILEGLNADDIAFATLMFHRRHVYEHLGGEADEKYIRNSGDTVRPKQALRETQESAHRIATTVRRIAANLHNGFHDIFPPDEAPIRAYEEQVRRIEAHRRG